MKFMLLELTFTVEKDHTQIPVKNVLLLKLQDLCDMLK